MRWHGWALAVTAMSAALAWAATGCGGSDSGGGGSSNSARSLFAARCGSCHTLKDAGTAGNIGPNLDQARPSKQVVLTFVKAGPGVMPANLVKGKEAQQVADYVSSVAGR